MAQRGRPRRVVPVTELELLTIPQAVLYLQMKGRGIDRTRLRNQIATGALAPVYIDHLHHDNQGRPTYRIPRTSLDRWLTASLQLLKVAHIA